MTAVNLKKSLVERHVNLMGYVVESREYTVFLCFIVLSALSHLNLDWTFHLLESSLFYLKSINQLIFSKYQSKVEFHMARIYSCKYAIIRKKKHVFQAKHINETRKLKYTSNFQLKE